ncbi:hypothetical protein CFP65_3721 [Kitasatospora sp. MMS16-BH015]|uniref:DUF4407 domain-containing protein n=1 Tax=Kitasatospora sp. MMS16-BH015 TaxID=2018025 RepID=UPI000CA1A9EC|nr:DUF4407 domain-containing protein [Kitasatospora sp. MMS16-BH015]AUG78507.1 hypothetical protein CFP65_3721 [Kitasatospora sp. MMS16-BH015]
MTDEDGQPGDGPREPGDGVGGPVGWTEAQAEAWAAERAAEYDRQRAAERVEGPVGGFVESPTVPLGARHARVESVRWPAAPDRGPARTLRKLIGIREELLDLTPDERSRYTKYAFVVLNTGLLAAVSMAVSVGKVVPGAPLLAVVPVALVWGWLILTLDGFLVSASHGVFDLRSKLVLLLPRLAVAVVVGLVIAEPLVLQIFQPSIRDQIRTSASAAASAEYKLWQDCSQATPPPGLKGCVDHTLPPSPALVSLQREQAETAQQLKTQQAEFDGLQAQLNTLAATTNAECNGATAPGTTGRRGKGPACDADTAAEQRFRTDQRMTQRAGELAALRDRQNSLTTGIQTATAAQAAEVNQGAKAKAEEYLKNHSGTGLLDEDRALEQVASDNFFVFAGVWLVRLLVLLLDCMPILVKFMGGATSYDSILADQLRSNVVRAGTRRRLEERSITVRQEVEIYRREQAAQADREEIEASFRVARARRNADLEAQINQLAEQYLSQSRWSTVRGGRRQAS